jgi:4-carboxymuconolactone decarboxylase
MKTLLGLTLSTAAALASAQETRPTVAVRPASTATTGPAATFTGTVRITTPFQAPDSGRAGGATVSFEPRARTAWHTHPFGQTLIVTAGVGLVQQAGEPARVIRPGDVVTIPAHVRHWHGASPTSAMTHVAIAEKLDGSSVAWEEKVEDRDYETALASTGLAPAAAPGGPSRAQQVMGDVAPKLAELTDQVLFGDVWERPGLAKRDRSLATVSALIAMNRPDQLRSHLALGLQNGLTRQEVSELITHLAFYAGWPSAVTATGVARDVFQNTPAP